MKNIQEELQIIEGKASKIPERNYWFVRSMGGDYYSDFVKGGFIAIGYNISLDKIRLALSKDSPQEALKKILVEDGYNPKSVYYPASQLIRFVKEIKIGDVVMVPKRGSTSGSIGIIESKAYEVEQKMDPHDKDVIDLLDEDCPFLLRRKIKWIDKYDRQNLNPKLFPLFNSRHIITNIDEYSGYIDSTINNFYVKDGSTFLVLRVKSQEAFSLYDFTILSDLGEFITRFNEAYNLDGNEEEDEKDIKATVNVQSPGEFLLWATQPSSLILIGLMIYVIKGGRIKVEQIGLDMGADSLSKNISEFLDRQENRKLQKSLRKKIENMEIENPDDLVKLLQAHDNIREKY